MARTGRPPVHGKTATREFTIWCGMKSRCGNKNHPAFERYGGRGIAVCDRWMNFENFYADMAPAPAGMTLDRIDNNKGYEPENCRWASVAEQARNSSRNRNITISGETMCASEWARRFGIKPATFITRLLNGTPLERASIPVMPKILRKEKA